MFLLGRKRVTYTLLHHSLTFSACFTCEPGGACRPRGGVGRWACACCVCVCACVRVCVYVCVCVYVRMNDDDDGSRLFSLIRRTAGTCRIDTCNLNWALSCLHAPHSSLLSGSRSSLLHLSALSGGFFLLFLLLVFAVVLVSPSSQGALYSVSVAPPLSPVCMYVRRQQPVPPLHLFTSPVLLSPVTSPRAHATLFLRHSNWPRSFQEVWPCCDGRAPTLHSR